VRKFGLYAAPQLGRANILIFEEIWDRVRLCGSLNSVRNEQNVLTMKPVGGRKRFGCAESCLPIEPSPVSVPPADRPAENFRGVPAGGLRLRTQD
jgi:hypothetical protein